MKKPSKKLLIGTIVGGVAMVGAALTTGTVFAQTTNTINPVVTRAAQIVGVDSQKLEDALTQAKSEEIDQMVKDGKITQTQADEMKTHINDGIGGMGMRGERGGRMKVFDDLATYLGMTKNDLMTQLKDGKKLSDIASAKGKTVDDVKNYLLTEMQTNLDNEVKNGKITQTQADEIKTRETQMITDLINGTMPTPPARGMKQSNSTTQNN